MNIKILTKCLDELNTPTPNISYLKGMLETLIEMSGGQVKASIMTAEPLYTLARTDEVKPEDEFLNKYNNGRTGELQ